ncbi:MAG: DPP IV N-terminal domain-containing protein [Isosphaeraceae bacterium]
MASGRTIGVVLAVAWSTTPGGVAAREPYRPGPEELRSAYARADRLRESYKGKVFKAAITPHWLDGDARFWYRNDGRDGSKEFILVEADKGIRSPAFDHARLAASLAKATSSEARAEALPFDSIEFGEGRKTLKFRARGFEWSCDLSNYELTRGKESTEPRSSPAGESGRPQFRGRGGGGAGGGSGPRTLGMFGPVPRGPDGVVSPDGKWVAEVREFNVVVRRAGERENEVWLSRDGSADRPFGELSWSPDSKTLVACRVDPATHKDVHLVESSPREGGRARLWTRPYDLPGDRMPSYELWLFDPETGKGIRPEVDPVDFRPASPAARRRRR